MTNRMIKLMSALKRLNAVAQLMAALPYDRTKMVSQLLLTSGLPIKIVLQIGEPSMLRLK